MAGVIPRMKLITVKMPEFYIEGIDELVRMGRYSSRSEVIRIAVRDLLKKELWLKRAET
ncbi:MAG: ribbon-helix-helix domain-containing protein [Desulfurococcus sp.]|nr:ribbon-helix-helix domain-containing protein [Desulfurococcus sp.]